MIHSEQRAMMSTPQKKVCIVEDDVGVNRMYERAFRFQGYDVVVAHDGATALEKCSDNGPTPAAVLLDLNLPHMSGFDVLKALRKDARYDSVPVLILSNSFAEDKSKECMDLGADGFMVKIQSQSKDIIAKVEELVAKGRSSAPRAS